MQTEKILKYLFAVVFTFAMFEGAVMAQGIHVDIGVQHLETDQIQIWLISDSTWTGYLSSIQWTLRWDEVSTATLSDLVASSSVAFLDGLPQSGPTGDANGYHQPCSPLFLARTPHPLLQMYRCYWAPSM